MPRKPTTERRPAPRRSTKHEVELRFYAPGARQVFIAGDFNDWDTGTAEMKSNGQGEWVTKIKLAPGKYEYKFFADGVWHNDPRATQRIANVWGSENSVLEVS